MSKEEREREAQIFLDAGIDPKAPYDSPKLDSALRQQANANALHDILSQTRRIHSEATGKKGGKRRKTRKGSKKSKKRKSKRRRYRK